ncbi:Re/Si-specific NAD(P)(+) transhydrogenase subunit alpha [Trueperella pecoris]|uniref:proton-translocating NAD(P)(+) transhydrogenase n=1 Tax=Trueperella pecoris TaxID=2733571 RepID=A0A7M1QRX3_9ACTO|nr:Re/Si-specific NAD(P)(+) transhydrogenase subunit alpha [Trueperella pecoris]QOQ38688.1 Re/Si-specific NAD(P)(+) transhydrogenase subunit alpha [Trueperella pecoris]QOR44820.1 Re/Si-specific NAD(P)(+) transhydrogenase subunit alpha [Trueperella pecoris]QTG74743.1 Re/Si-specific NAD(P)(+) transhydrogenase subunit alpha [Trueperella pecoris]
MRIGVPRESDEQALVAATPDTVGKLIKLGYEVVVEHDAGARASFPDTLYDSAGARIVSKEEAWAADIVTALDAPASAELDMMRQGATLIARMAPGRHQDILDALSSRGITGLAMDMVPRISRAQSMDVLSSLANVAGYRSVIEAAHHFGRLFSGQVTAAGKVAPASVYVIGAGVAGLAAIGTANSMGAIVKATDVRAETAEQVESMGAQFVAIPVAAQESSDGYAKEMGQEQARAAEALYAEQAAAADVVITTAAIPGRRSPVLLTAEAVAGMKPGSVVVDMGAANGGNVVGSRPDEVVVTENGVTIIGYTELAGRLPAQSSQLYGQNVVNFFKLTTPEKDGMLHLDLDDEIVRQMLVTLEERVMFPPPPVRVSAAPVARPAPVAPAEPEPVKEKSWVAKHWWKAAAAALFTLLILAAPPGSTTHFMVFLLSVVIGFYVITAVTHALHTPLMSVTNAISGIIVVGALLQVGAHNLAVQILAFIAIAVASINIFGGFLVTERMLKMFHRS